MTEFVVFACASWVIGLLLRSGEDPNDAMTRANGRPSDLLLLPWSCVSMFRQERKGPPRRKWYEALASVILMVGFWALCVLVAVAAWEYLAKIGGCPEGEHLAGGQGGSGQYCEP